MARIGLPSAAVDVEVTLTHDGLDRVYRARVLTRSVKHKIMEAQDRLEAAEDEVPASSAPTPEQEEKLMRAACDVLSLVLVAPDDAPEAGDLLYDAWLAEEATDDQILGLMTQITKASADPT